MSFNRSPTHNDILMLSERVLESIVHIQTISILPLSHERRGLILDLYENSQTYLVFLEESAQKLKEDQFVSQALLLPIIKHCDSIEKAWLEIQ